MLPASFPASFPALSFSRMPYLVPSPPNLVRTSSLEGIASGISELLKQSHDQKEQLQEINDALDLQKEELVYQRVSIRQIEQTVDEQGRLLDEQGRRLAKSESQTKVTTLLAQTSHTDLSDGRSEDTKSFLIETASRAAREALKKRDMDRDAELGRALRRRSTDVFWKVVGAGAIVIAGLFAAAVWSQARPSIGEPTPATLPHSHLETSGE